MILEYIYSKFMNINKKTVAVNNVIANNLKLFI